MDNALPSQRLGTPAFSQLQPTQMPQGSQSAGFTMTEVLRIALIAQKLCWTRYRVTLTLQPRPVADIQRGDINALADKAKSRTSERKGTLYKTTTAYPPFSYAQPTAVIDIILELHKRPSEARKEVIF
ncbi:hypothetical protein E4U39_002382 [Claviceps sp. Clav50 group G5]|nr:hypothetical protein E4U39_002382 [Claviceps sp. Clav50 group G5]